MLLTSSWRTRELNTLITDLCTFRYSLHSKHSVTCYTLQNTQALVTLQNTRTLYTHKPVHEHKLNQRVILNNSLNFWLDRSFFLTSLGDLSPISKKNLGSPYFYARSADWDFVFWHSIRCNCAAKGKELNAMKPRCRIDHPILGNNTARTAMQRLPNVNQKCPNVGKSNDMSQNR